MPKVSSKFLWWSFFGLAFIALVWIQYYGLAHYQYLVPPGDDPMNHFLAANNIFEQKESVFSILQRGGYPPAYHFMVAKAAEIFQADPLDIIKWSYPGILILCSLAVFLLAYSILGIEAGTAAFFIYSFATRLPVQTINDGSYPNLLAAQFLLPLGLAFLTFFIKSRSKYRMWLLTLSILILLLIPLTHHFTTFYLLAIGTVAWPVVLVSFWIFRRWQWKRGLLLFLIYFTLISGLAFVFLNTSLFTSAKSLASTMIHFGSSYPFFEIVATAKSVAWKIPGDFISNFGTISLLILVLGFLAFPIILFRTKDKNWLFTFIFIYIWAIILFIGSRMTFLSNPDRLARDMTLPLAISAGVLLGYLAQDNKKIFSFKILLLTIFVIALFLPVKQRIISAKAYEPMIRATSADMEIFAFIKAENINPEKVLMQSFNFYAPKLLPGFREDYCFDGINCQGIYPERDYLIMSTQLGWLPSHVRTDSPEIYTSLENLILVKHSQSPINDVYLFKIIHPNNF
ncbi:MAG: hypothetical protein WC107_00420 [Patescibacteria group bacterium]